MRQRLHSDNSDQQQKNAIKSNHDGPTAPPCSVPAKQSIQPNSISRELQRRLTKQLRICPVNDPEYNIKFPPSRKSVVKPPHNWYTILGLCAVNRIRISCNYLDKRFSYKNLVMSVVGSNASWNTKYSIMSNTNRVERQQSFSNVGIR